MFNLCTLNNVVCGHTQQDFFFDMISTYPVGCHTDSNQSINQATNKHYKLHKDLNVSIQLRCKILVCRILAGSQLQRLWMDG